MPKAMAVLLVADVLVVRTFTLPEVDAEVFWVIWTMVFVVSLGLEDMPVVAVV